MDLQELERIEDSPSGERLTADRKFVMSDVEFLQQLNVDIHAEWIDGEAIVFMPPTTRHQRIVSFLHLLIGTFLQHFRYGELFEAPYAMRIEANGPVREPDLLYIANENAHLISDMRLDGPADLIVEVISTESVGRDRADKFYDYQAGGVREYWGIDPRPGLTRADFWILDENMSYRPIPIAADQLYHSTVLPNFTLDVSVLHSDNLPDPLKVLAKMVGKDILLRALETDE